jgi:hypothetical protein
VNGVSDGQIETLALNGSEKYMIEHINRTLTTLLFNNSELAAGQRVGIGGELTTRNGACTAVHRVVPRRQGSVCLRCKGRSRFRFAWLDSYWLIKRRASR